MSTDPECPSVHEALGRLRSAMGCLAAADPTAMSAETLAQCLIVLEQAASMGTAARASVLGTLTATKAYQVDADYSPRSWLVHHTGITKGAAAGHTAWARRAAAHPRILQALATADLSESVARTLCGWTDKLPGDCRDAADAILVTAANAGADLRGLAELAAEIYARSVPGTPGDDGAGDGFEDRSVTLDTTFEGAGVLRGDLTAECAAVVTTVLDALSAPCGADDTRSHAQRYHDALGEAMRRLLAAGLVPERAGQPAKALAHISLADLMVLDGSSALQAEWSERVRAEWAAARAGASVGGSDGAAWLDGEAAAAFTCDAALTPVVTGEVNHAALDGLVRLCVELARIDGTWAGTGDSEDRAGDHIPATRQDSPVTAPATPGPAREALERAIISKAVDLVSGPGGLASFLRRMQLGARLAGPSLPLDIGVSKDIPAGIRNLVILRDRHCRWPGCHQPAAACQVHHIRHKAHGGHTSVRTCILLCWFHHQVVIHRWGWTLVLNPDGTTTAWNPDKTRVLHSHSPPRRAA